MEFPSTDFGRAAANSLFFVGHEPGRPHRPIGYPRNYRDRAHLAYYGTTNSGKSFGIEYALQQLARRQRAGFCFIDPHGKTYWRLASYLRQHGRTERVLFWDLNDPEYVTTWNPFAMAVAPPGERPEQSVSAVASGLTAALLGTLGSKSKDASDYPQLKTLTEAGLRMMMKAGVPFVLGKDVFDPEDTQIRNSLAAASGERSLLGSLDALPNLERSRLLGAPARRFENLWSVDALRLAFVSEGLRFAELMEDGWIILVNAEARREDAEAGYVFIRLLVNQLFSAAKRRPPVASTRPFFLVIDEASRYLSGDTARILAEARKYSFYLVAGMQGLEQARLEDERSYVALRENVGAEVVLQLLDPDEQTYFSEKFFGYRLDHRKVKHVECRRGVIPYLRERDRTSSSRSWDEDGKVRYGETSSRDPMVDYEEIEDRTPFFFTSEELLRTERARFYSEQRFGMVRLPHLRHAQEVEIPRLKKVLYRVEEMADWLDSFKSSQPATMRVGEAEERFERIRNAELERLRAAAPPPPSRRRSRSSTERLIFRPTK